MKWTIPFYYEHVMVSDCSYQNLCDNRVDNFASEYVFLVLTGVWSKCVQFPCNIELASFKSNWVKDFAKNEFSYLAI